MIERVKRPVDTAMDAIDVLMYFVAVTLLPYSGLFSNQIFSHKCLNINFGGFYFRSQYILKCIYEVICARQYYVT